MQQEPLAKLSPIATAGLLRRQLKGMQTDKGISGISCGLGDDENIFEWDVVLMINDDCKYYGGGIFTAQLVFPTDYPMMPPKMTFKNPVPWHPNIYKNGEVCISILHPPEEDKYGYELASERWSPAQNPETILISVLSMLNDPNDESPANQEAAQQWRDNRKEFRRTVRRQVDESLEGGFS